jgi:copper chaperone CopZ
MRYSIVLMVLCLHVSTADAETIEIKVNGLVCGFCAQGIEKTLRKNPATADVLVSLEERLVAVETKEGQDIPDEELETALRDSGYDVTEITRSEARLGEIRERLESTMQ